MEIMDTFSSIGSDFNLVQLGRSIDHGNSTEHRNGRSSNLNSTGVNIMFESITNRTDNLIDDTHPLEDIHETYCVWPDGTYCLKEDLAEYSWKSDDYEILTDAEYDPDQDWEDYLYHRVNNKGA